MNRVFRKNAKLTKIICTISAAAIVTGGIAFYLSKDNRVLASAMAEGKEVPQNLDAVSAINYATILGRATDFGIVANDFEQVTHMETTFAVNTFSNSSGQVNEVDFITNSAQFMIGQIGSGKVKFGGNQTAYSYNIEASELVFSNFDTEWNSGRIFNDTDANTSNFYFDNAGSTWYDSNGPVTPVYTVEKAESAINANINNVIGNATASSDYISMRANDPTYALDYTQYLTLDTIARAEYDPMDQNTGDINTANRFFINIDKAEFENKVVYINVDENLARVMANSEGLCIIKHPSTVVCFNIEPGISNTADGGLILNRIDVSEDGGENFCWSVTASQGNSTATQSTGSVGRRNTQQFNNADVDRMINQKIIMNVRSDSSNIQLDAIAGTTLIPNPSSVANVKGSSTGWVVAGGKLRNAGGEWHYIYQGGSQDLINQNTGNEIHFALHKNFTSDNGQTTDNSVFIQEDQFTFNLYQLDNVSSFDDIDLGDIPYAVRTVTAKNKATGNVQFDPMTFTPGDYYFIIKEDPQQNPNLADSSITNSDGYIKIHLKVEAGDPDNNVTANTFTVHYAYYLHAADQTPFREERDVVMMGVQFDLLGFYNFVQPTGTISIDKSLLGVDSNDIPSDYVVPVYVQSGNTYYGVDMYGNLISSDQAIVNEVHPGSTYILRDLPLDRTYTVREASHPSITDYSFVSVSGESNHITLNASTPNANVSLQNTYKKNDISNTLYIAKIASDTHQILEGATFTLTYTGEDSNAYILSGVTVTGGTSVNNSGRSITFTTRDASNVTFSGLPNGSYTLSETSAPTGYSVIQDTSFTLQDQIVTFAGNAPSGVIFDSSSHILTVTDQSTLGTLRINKSIALDPHYSGAFSKDMIGTVEFKIEGPSSFNNNAPMYVSLNAFEYDSTTGEYVFTQSVPAGDYTITEVRDGSNTRYTCTTTVGSTVTDHANVAVATGGTGSVAFSNVYKPTTGSLVITKTIYGITDLGSIDPIVFEISPRATTNLTETRVELGSDWQSVGWIRNGNTYTYTFSYVTPGYYDITESTTGANSSYTCNVVPSGRVSVAQVYEGDIPIVPANFTNTYSRVTGTVEIDKVTIAGNNNYTEIAGARLEITSTTGANMSACSVTGGGQSSASVTAAKISYTSGTAPTSIAGLPEGTYVLHEVAAPSGYIVATDITFSVDAYGNVTGSNVSTASGHAVVQMVDNAIKVDISKTDVGGVEIPGAEITVTRTDGTDLIGCSVTRGNASVGSISGNVISFTSGNEPTTISALPAGTYVMHEVTPPNGYQVATDITFTVAADGTVTGTNISSSASGNPLVTMADDAATTVVISKQDVSSNELAGAQLTLTAVDGNNNPIDLTAYRDSTHFTGGGTLVTNYSGQGICYTSGTEPTTIADLPDGTYTLHEDSAPGTEYSVSTDIVFTLSAGTVTAVDITAPNSISGNTVTMVDGPSSTAQTDIELSKVEVAGNDYAELQGAQLTLTAVDGNGNPIDLSAYRDGTHFTGGGQIVTTYTGNGICYESGSTPTSITGLPNGTYTLHEDSAPSTAYSVSTDIVFRLYNGTVSAVTVNGSNTVDASAHKITMVDELNTVDISKVDAVSSNELPGASISITGPDGVDYSHLSFSGGHGDAALNGNVITFTSDTTPTRISGLPAGEYTMVEVTPPDRYQVATTITFTVNADGTVTGNEVTAATNNSPARVTMADALTVVDFSKVATGATTELQGADITITNLDGTSIANCEVSGGATDIHQSGNTISYTSGTSATTITGLPDGSYQMVENAAPFINGVRYQIATPIDFEIADGVVLVSSNPVTTSATTGHPVIVMEDDVLVENNTGTVDISKVQLGDNDFNEIPGAVITITGPADGNYSGCTISNPDSNFTSSRTDNVITFTSNGALTTISGLPAGTYTMHEVTPPNGFMVAETDITFTVDAGGNITGDAVVTPQGGGNAIVRMADALTVVDISKVRVGGGNELDGAVIRITGPDGADYSRCDFPSYVSQTGNVITFTSIDAPTTLRGLPAGTYVMHEDAAPNGYQVATDITFTINADGSVTGNNVSTNAAGRAQVTMSDSATTNITLSKVEVAGNGYNELPNAVLTLTAVDNDGNPMNISGYAISGGGTRDTTYTGSGIRYRSGDSPTTIDELPDGVYTLHEDTAPDNRYSVSTDIVFRLYNGTVTGVTVEGSNSVSGNTVRMVDEMNATTDIVISKVEAAGNGNYTELPDAVLTLTAVDGNGSPINISNISISGGGTRDNSYTGSGIRYRSGDSPTNIFGLPNGTYTLHEDSAPNSNYSVSTDIVFTLDNGTVTPVSVQGDNSISGTTITMVDGPATTPPVDQCSLTLIKDVVSNGASVPTSFTFYVENGGTYYGLDANGALISDTTPIAISVAYGSPVTLTGLPNGTYNVTEERTGTGATGYDLAVTGEGAVTLDDSDQSTISASVTITNTYTSTAPITGSLTIVKNIGDGAPTSAYAMDYTFTVTGPNGYSTDVVIHGAGSQTLTGLVPGTYTVTEQASSATIGGYQWTATGDGVATVNVVAGNTPSVVTITNTYNETTVQTSATTASTTTEATTASATSTSTEATSATEDTTTDTEATTSETTATTTEVTTRVYITAMDINISKQDIAGAEIDGAVLTITNAPGNSVNFLASGVTALQDGLPASGLEVTADKLQFTTVSSSQALIHNLPVGHYVLTETIAPRGYLIAESINFEVRNDGTVWVAGTPEDQMVERIVMQDLADPTVGQAARTTPVVSRVTANGLEITSDHFTVNSDGTITVSEDYARVLGVGRHRIEVTMSDGTTRIFYITVNSDGSVTQTGESRVSASSVLAVVMLAAGGMVFIVRKKLSEKEE